MAKDPGAVRLLKKDRPSGGLAHFPAVEDKNDVRHNGCLSSFDFMFGLGITGYFMLVFNLVTSFLHSSGRFQSPLGSSPGKCIFQTWEDNQLVRKHCWQPFWGGGQFHVVPYCAVSFLFSKPGKVMEFENLSFPGLERCLKIIKSKKVLEKS